VLRQADDQEGSTIQIGHINLIYHLFNMQRTPKLMTRLMRYELDNITVLEHYTWCVAFREFLLATVDFARSLWQASLV
jgi:hypothetical protein